MLGIILSRRDFREYDQIISLYTRDEGKREALARGIKKITSKNSAHCEPFSLVDVGIIKGKELDHITTVQPMQVFRGIRESLEKSLAAGYVVRTTDQLLQTGERDVRIFDGLFGWLKYVEETRNKKLEIVQLVDGYIVLLLHCLGFSPVLEICVICGKTFRTMMKESLAATIGSELLAPNSGLYFAGGGLICGDDKTKKREVGEYVLDCGLKEVSDMQELLKGDWRLIGRYELADDERIKLHRLVYEFLLFHSERKVGDWSNFCTE
ncbi:MAG: DNA repair protein RecO [Patescibacteria group bacterium]